MGFGNIGIGELIMIFLVVMLVFGPKRMPEIARNMGKFMRDFRRETNAAIKELKDGIEPINVGIFDEPDAGAAETIRNGAAAAMPGVAAAGGAAVVPTPVDPAPPANGSRAKRAAPRKTSTTRKPATATRKSAPAPAKKRAAAKPKPKRPAARAGAARKR
jgi:sec-independent protein translocase protein TatB